MTEAENVGSDLPRESNAGQSVRELSEDELAALSDDDLLELGIDLYNAGHFFEAHEAWEEVWLRAEQAERAFYQGLIQITAAFVHLKRNEYPGTVKLLAEGIAKLERYGQRYRGIELKPLVEGASVSRQRIIELGEKRLREFEDALIPKIAAQ